MFLSSNISSKYYQTINHSCSLFIPDLVFFLDSILYPGAE